MNRTAGRTSTIALFVGALFVGEALAAEPMAQPMQPMMQAGHGAADDTRELLKLSPETIEALRGDMRMMMGALAQVLGQLAEGQRSAAARTLEEGLGMSAMSTHPGMMKASREMPDSARMLGMSMHRAASELAKTIGDAQPAQVYAGLQQITAGCTSCHMAYRVR